MIKKNLIFFISNFSIGGAGNSISKLCLKLPRNEFEISIICIGKSKYSNTLKKRGINVYELKKKRLIFSIFELNKLIKNIFKKNLKNILISNIHYNNVLLTLLIKNIGGFKLILVERTPLEELNIFFSISDFFKKKIIKFLVNLTYNLSDVIITNSHGIKNGFPKYLRGKIKVIYPPSIIKISNLKKITQNPKIFKSVCFSRLSIEKNLECAIKSFNYLRNINISLTIYGDGNLRKKLHNLVKKYNLKKKVFLKSHTNNVNKEMKKFDILISPSFFEGCSNSIIEALNNDLVVVASDCPGGNKEILSKGKSGELFSTNDAYDLSKKL
jgi:GalNAc-alpha-(1->4)-GalNAc-alpha-(1->3)-diNAcBac-PP-undecaprenol alpha-1,4-N-acetyl-D-galactosaminyltransferase